jgi:hypothetical protein
MRNIRAQSNTPANENVAMQNFSRGLLRKRNPHESILISISPAEGLHHSLVSEPARTGLFGIAGAEVRKRSDDACWALTVSHAAASKVTPVSMLIISNGASQFSQCLVEHPATPPVQQHSSPSLTLPTQRQNG